jgi:hypothetical protein
MYRLERAVLGGQEWPDMSAMRPEACFLPDGMIAVISFLLTNFHPSIHMVKSL